MAHRTGTLDGQVFAIPVRDGFGYFQALFFVKKWGHWIRVMRGVHPPPVHLPADLAARDVQFYTFFPLKQAITAGIVRSVGSLPIHVNDRSLPRLKTPGGVLRDGTVTDWFIVDGDNCHKVQRLSDEDKRLQEQMVVNDTALADMIAEGWTPETSISVRKSL